MEWFFTYMPSRLINWLRNQDSDEQDKDVVTELTKEKGLHQNIYPIKVHLLAWQLYHLEFSRQKIIQELSEDLDLAEATVEVYVKQFDFKWKCMDEALRSFLKVFWPEDQPAIQDLLITHFSHQFLKCKGHPLTFQPGVYYATCATIILNADLNGHHKGRKMTCEEFQANLNNTCGVYTYNQQDLKNIYTSIKSKPLEAFIVKTRDQAEGKNEISIPEDSGCRSSPGTDNNPTSTVHKTGNLTCKRVLDKSGRKIRKCRRAWKLFTAVLKGMDLYLQQDTSGVCETDSKNAIRLHHAMAYTIDYKNRPHVLCLRTADSRLFYFQAESEVEQTSWVVIINLIAARYSAPALTSASSNIKLHHPLVLPSYPTTLSLEQQLEKHKDQLQRLSESMDYHLKLPLLDGALHLEYMEQEVQRYSTYIRALQELLVEEDAGEGCSNSNLHQFLPLKT